MVVADLHVHTSRSDGTLSPDALAGAARRADLEAIAITDHDMLPPFESAIQERDGVEVIAGIELRVQSPNQNLDLLGYGVRPTPALREALDRLQRDRRERARKIVARVEDRTGVDLDVSFEAGVGRPHIARAIAESPAPYDRQGAFDHLIGDDGPCYVARNILSFARGKELLEEASALVGLAHPLRYDDPLGAIERAADLDALEREYAYEGNVDLSPVGDAIETHDLVATGGSDAHGERLGETGLSEEEYTRVRQAIEREL